MREQDNDLMLSKGWYQVPHPHDEWDEVVNPKHTLAAPFTVSAKKVVQTASALKTVTLASGFSFLEKMGHYGFQMLSTVPHVLSDCIRYSDQLPIFSFSKNIICQDIIPVFFAWCFYSTAENMLQDQFLAPVILYPLYVLTATFCFYRMILFYAHKGFASLELSRQFYEFSKIFYETDAKKKAIENTQVKDEALCEDCNSFRVIKGNIRGLVFFIARQLFFEILHKVPVISKVSSVITLPLTMLMTAQDVFDFFLSEQYCERHVRANLRQYPELFFVFGLLHYLVVNSILFGVQSFNAAIVGFLRESLVGDLFMISTLLKTIETMPVDFLHRYVSGTAFLFFVGLACYFPFPKIVQASTRYSPEFGTYWIADELVEYISHKMKRAFQANQENTIADRKKNLRDEKSLFDPEEIKKGAWSLKKSVTRKIKSLWRTKKNQLVVLKEIPTFVDSFDRANEYYKMITWGLSNALLRFDNRTKRTQYLRKLFLPVALHDQFYFLDDVIFQRQVPKIILKIYEGLNAFLKYRETIVDNAQFIMSINNLCSSRAMQLISWGLGLSKVCQMLTFDFIANHSQKYIEDMYQGLKLARGLRLITKETYQERFLIILELEKKLSLVQRLLNSVSENAMDAAILFIQTEECTDRIRYVMDILMVVLSKHPCGKEALDKIHEFSVIDKKEIADCMDLTDLQKNVRVTAQATSQEVPVPVPVPVQTVALNKAESFEVLPSVSSGEFDANDIPMGHEEFRATYGVVKKQASTTVFQRLSGRLFDSTKPVEKKDPSTEPSFVRRHFQMGEV